MINLIKKHKVVNDRTLRLFKEGSWIIAGQILYVLGALALVKVLTEWLNPAEYGELALGLTLGTLLSQTIIGGVGSGIYRYFAVACEQQDIYNYLAASSKLILISTGVSILVGSVIAFCLALTGYHQWVSIVIAVVCYSIFGAYNGILNAIQNANRQRKIVAMHNAMESWLKIIIAVLLLYWIGGNSVVVVSGFAMSTFLITLSQIIFLRKTILSKSPVNAIYSANEWSTKIWRYSWPFSLWGIFSWIHQASDRWALGFFAATEDVGLFAVIYQLGYVPISLLLGLTMSFLSPILYQRAGDASDIHRIHSARQVIWYIAITTLTLTGLAFMITAVLHDWLMNILVADEYQKISYLLPWAILSGGLFASAQMLSEVKLLTLKSNELLIPKILSAILGVSLNFLGASKAGLDGVVVAMVFFSVVYLLWMLALALIRE